LQASFFNQFTPFALACFTMTVALIVLKNLMIAMATLLLSQILQLQHNTYLPDKAGKMYFHPAVFAEFEA